MAMLESAETQIAGLWGLASPTKATPSSTPQAPRTSAGKAKPAKFRKQDKGVGKGQQAGRKRQEPPEDEETGDQVLVSRTELRTIRALLVRHDQALNHLAVDRTYVLFFSTTEMSTLTMLRTVTNHWREQYEQGKCTTTLRAALLTSLWMELEARLTKFEAGREHLRSGCGIHPGIDNEIQSGESPCGDDQIGKLCSAVADRPAPSSGEAPAQPVGQGFGRHKAVSSSGSPHCRAHKVFSGEASLTSSCASVCVPDSSMATQCHREGVANNPVDSRLRSPHGRGASSQPGDYGETASFHRASSRNRDAISGDGGRHRGVHTDLSAGQRGEQQTERQSKPATFASLPSRLRDSLTQTTLPWQASGRVTAIPSAPPVYCLRNRSNFCDLTQ